MADKSSMSRAKWPLHCHCARHPADASSLCCQALTTWSGEAKGTHFGTCRAARGCQALSCWSRVVNTGLSHARSAAVIMPLNSRKPAALRAVCRCPVWARPIKRGRRRADSADHLCDIFASYMHANCGCIVLPRWWIGQRNSARNPLRALLSLAWWCRNI